MSEHQLVRTREPGTWMNDPDEFKFARKLSELETRIEALERERDEECTDLLNLARENWDK